MITLSCTHRQYALDKKVLHVLCYTTEPQLYTTGHTVHTVFVRKVQSTFDTLDSIAVAYNMLCSVSSVYRGLQTLWVDPSV